MKRARPSRPLRSVLWTFIVCACAVGLSGPDRADPAPAAPAAGPGATTASATTAQPPTEAVPATPGKVPVKHASSRARLRQCGRTADARALRGPERSAFVRTCMATRRRPPPPQNTASR